VLNTRECPMLVPRESYRMHGAALNIRFDDEHSIGQAALNSVALCKCRPHRRHANRILTDEATITFQETFSQATVCSRVNLVEPVRQHSNTDAACVQAPFMSERVAAMRQTAYNHETCLNRRRRQLSCHLLPIRGRLSRADNRQAALNVDRRDSVFIAALSSGETTADPNRALPFITKESAGIVGVRFATDALQKNAHGKIHSLYTVGERNAELDKAQYQAQKLGAKNVFVFDDLITRGDTLSRIAMAILEANPKSKVYGVALAKNESTDYCPNPDNAHVPAEWDKLWRQGEEEAAKAKKG
jgi:hypothetical protein